MVLPYYHIITYRTYDILGGDEEGYAPSFVDKPKIIPNDAGTLITMKCKCKAKPKPNVTWYRGTTAVKENSKISMKTIDNGDDTYDLILEIQVSVTNSWYELITIALIGD